jgi:hypothetical protein
MPEEAEKGKRHEGANEHISEGAIRFLVTDELTRSVPGDTLDTTAGTNGDRQAYLRSMPFEFVPIGLKGRIRQPLLAIFWICMLHVGHRCSTCMLIQDYHMQG